MTQHSQNKELYSVVIPVYNSEKILSQTIQEVEQFFESERLQSEIILVNDSSTDNSWNVLTEQTKHYSNIIVVDLARNYGQHSAVLCGIGYASGDFIITMDDDLQNPPQEIEHLINKIQEGYDAVFGKFKAKMHGSIRKLGSTVVGYLNYKIFNKPKNLTLTNFRIFRKSVAEGMLRIHTPYPYIPGLVLLNASRLANVEVEHHPRQEGKSHYTPLRIFKLMTRLLFNYSSYPLRLLSTIGFVVAMGSFAAGIAYISIALFRGVRVPGWTTLVVLMSFLNGFLIMLVGIIGEYLARILVQTSGQIGIQIREVIREKE